MDDGRAKAIQDGAVLSTGGKNWNYVDVTILERLGIAKYATKKPNGNNFIRMVAPSAQGAFAKEVWIHSNVGADKNTYICMEKTFGEPCGVCDHIKANPGVKDLAASRRFLVYVVDTTTKDTENEGTKWFDCPVSIYKEVCNLSKDKRTGASIDPTDPVNGRDIEFVRTDGTRTSYSGFKLEKTGPIPEQWYTGLPPYDEILLRPDYNAVKTAVSGVGKVEDSTSPNERREAPAEGRSRDDSSTERRRSEVDPAETALGRRSRRDATPESAQDDEVQRKLEEIRNRNRSSN